ncbi:hypothetical protein ZIOFF_023016 [Zingiber officinale]|uniref:Formamidopyrimidine-DNA glycosylase catalytic domain-containing protein n=1 Tax=Zingiber officinale TaxID=94328 RepID=A0A8J5HDK9_ZINOF|nr:hypothetical protein ZIOFF_023016 [Zingiber officinale]
MPELPEVEVARRAIEEHCVGKRIVQCSVADNPKVIDGVTPSDLESALVGKTIVLALRMGKDLWLRLDSPPFHTFQFGMAGAIYIKGMTLTKSKRFALLISETQNKSAVPVPCPYAFDGQPPELKKQELAKKLVFTVLYSKREDATNDLNTTIERELKSRAKGLSSMQCSTLCKSDKVFVVASEDMDTLTFEAPRFLRHLMDPSSKKISVMEFEVSKVLEELRLTMDQFIDLCILSDVIIVIALKYDNACVVEYGVSAATVPFFNVADVLGLATSTALLLLLLLLLSAASAVLYSIMITNATMICNLALVVAALDDCSRLLPTLKAFLLVRGHQACVDRAGIGFAGQPRKSEWLLWRLCFSTVWSGNRQYNILGELSSSLLWEAFSIAYFHALSHCC